ncbi:GNAT family N-acetyltransferase [Faecalibacter rhinopitheci]|uniref:GNAT family N-acetyltransferase n=1 Tax=Faecalibacter rhinopitheci TaxID=2779678 RepID=A0A8J7G4X3_9FLAO|nr:GNAT family N-acetyltransferase [Faecalibacter rhinopitheci]MBF0596717.1 GNAT family N-acetyltransferase [Faecalibacter rhinopitheci]MBQ0147545.1 GNAT family N-acetyltransferase [Candidatus Onthonaster equi]
MKTICETKSLVLREFLDIDAYDLFILNSEKEVIKAVNEKPYLSEDEALFFIEKMIEHYHEFGFGLWGVYERKSGRFVGWAGMRQTKYGPVLNIRFKKKFWNKGYGTEALNAVINYAVNDLKMKKIAAKAVPSQPVTIKLLDKTTMVRSEENPLIYRLP